MERFSEPIAYSIEDELGVTNIHAVYNDKLYCYHFKEVYGRECGFTTNLVLAGLQWIDTEEVLTYIWSAVRIHETEREGWFEQRARELSEQRTLEQAAFDRFMASLKTLSHPVQAIWAYGDTHSEWVIRAEDGHELARGPGVDHGLRSYQRAHALVKEFGPPGSSLDTRLSPAEEMSFYPD